MDKIFMSKEAYKQLKENNSLPNHAEIYEKIEDWIANLAMRDNGKLFIKDTNESELAPVTYGDLRKLIKIMEA